GMTVKKGDLLISGIYQTASGVVSASARGEVRGRVRRTVEVCQPLFEVVKDYGKRSILGISVNFFGREIKLFKSGGKSEGEYDIIKRKEEIALPGGLRLPIVITREYALPYTERRVPLTEEEAARAARLRLNGELVTALADAEVLAESLRGELTDEGFWLRCDVDCVTDIAAPLAYQSDLLGG
ncbi:MAG: sporulation protein YqfD, partial [Clostridia bacterium]|nr:sporulation protein YqfD [Clostridia bacterium]